MPPSTLWLDNPNTKLTAANGNIAFDDSGTKFDSTLVSFDGVPSGNLMGGNTGNTPNPTLWSTPSPES